MAQDTGTRSVALVIFDCDGVLVDSEAATCGLCAQAARDAGMVVSDEDSIETFSGMALPLIRTMIERETGSTLAPDWTAMMQARFVAAMEKGARPVPGVYTMLDTVRAMGLPMRVGTNSSMEEMTVKFAATNLGPYFGDRIHSAVDVGAPKPRPDIYLTAARHEGVPPPCLCGAGRQSARRTGRAGRGHDLRDACGSRKKTRQICPVCCGLSICRSFPPFLNG
jgi:beta-phosphoglucomutase-like phosphatase (HAD superfamily)